MLFVKEYRILYMWLGVGNAQHCLYIKDHADRTDRSQKDRVLFVGNIDFDHILSNEEVSELMRDIFGGFGEIENIAVSEFQSIDSDANPTANFLSSTNGRNARFAHVVFKKKSTLKSALQAADAIYNGISQTIGLKWGLGNVLSKKTASEIVNMFPLMEYDVSDLKQEVDQYMLEFEENELMSIKERERMRNKADADGFITVKSRKKRKRELQKRGSSGPRSRNKKKGYELVNFYRYQMREQKRNQLEELRKRFEADKQQVAKMKEARKFNPF